MRLALLLSVVACSLTANLVVGDDDDQEVPSLDSLLGPNQIDFSDDSDVKTADDPAAPCCFPKVWQGRLKSEFGFAGQKKPSSILGIDQVYVDGANTRLAGDKLDFGVGPKPLNISYILLVGANKTAKFYLFSKSQQKCRSKVLKNVVWKQQCIPANATLFGTFSLGPGAGGLSVQSWGFFSGKKQASVADYEAPPRPTPRPPPRPQLVIGGNILVTPGSCIPVVIQEHGVISRGPRDDDFEESEYYGEKPKPSPSPKPGPRPKPKGGEAFVGSIYFSNLATSISDPSVFTPPSYCSKNATRGLFFDGDLQQAEDQLSTLLDRFIMF